LPCFKTNVNYKEYWSLADTIILQLTHYLWKIKVQICDKLHTRLTFSDFSPSVMVSVCVGISKLGITELIFVDLGVKISGGYYSDMLLSQQLLPMMRDVSDNFFIF